MIQNLPLQPQGENLLDQLMGGQKAILDQLQNKTAMDTSHSAVGDHIDISDQAKALMNGFEDMPMGDMVKDFINTQFEDFESALGGSVNMFKASVNITAGKITTGDGTEVSFMKVSIEMVAVSISGLSEMADSAEQIDAIRDSYKSALDFMETLITKSLEQTEAMSAESKANMLDMFKELKEDSLNMLDDLKFIA